MLQTLYRQNVRVVTSDRRTPSCRKIVTLDLVGGLMPAIKETGHMYYIVIIDKFSKYTLLEGVS